LALDVPSSERCGVLGFLTSRSSVIGARGRPKAALLLCPHSTGPGSCNIITLYQRLIGRWGRIPPLADTGVLFGPSLTAEAPPGPRRNPSHRPAIARRRPAGLLREHEPVQLQDGYPRKDVFIDQVRPHRRADCCRLFRLRISWRPCRNEVPLRRSDGLIPPTAEPAGTIIIDAPMRTCIWSSAAARPCAMASASASAARLHVSRT
jgi:hypothetical protein